MFALALIIVLVGATEDDPSTQAMQGALTEALGSSETVELAGTLPLPNDDGVQRIQRERDADVVATVRWERDRCTIHLRRRGQPGWSERKLHFSRADAPRERGRAAGFSLSALISRPNAEPDPSSTEPPSSPVPPANPLEPTTSPPPAEATVPAPAPSSSFVPPRFELDLRGVFALGVDRREALLGPQATAWMTILPGIAVGLGTSFRVDLDSDLRVSQTGMSVMASLWRGRSSSLGLSVGGFARWMSAQRGPQEVRQSRWVPVAAAALEWTAPISRILCLRGSMGAETALGITRVWVGGERVDQLATIHLDLSLGLAANW